MQSIIYNPTEQGTAIKDQLGPSDQYMHMKKWQKIMLPTSTQLKGLSRSTALVFALAYLYIFHFM